MSKDFHVPFPAIDDCPPPLYDDIFTGDDDPEDASSAGGGWEGEVDPQLFTSSNLFSADDTPDSGQHQEATPGGLIFPDLPTLGGQVPDLFGSGHQIDSGASGTNVSTTSKDISTVSIVDQVSSSINGTCPSPL